MRIDPSIATTPLTDTKPRTAANGAPATGSDDDDSSVVKLGASVGEEVQIPSAVTKRIQEIRAALARGAYPMDLDRLASRLVDDELSRGGGR